MNTTIARRPHVRVHRLPTIAVLAIVGVHGKTGVTADPQAPAPLRKSARTPWLNGGL
jgi:hypothetical protein